MSKGPTRVQRLVRLNQFREDQAGDALREASVQQQRARDEHESATDTVHGIGEWKTRGQSAGGLDLGFYGAALELELLAMARADELKQSLVASEQHTERAKASLIAAACAMRVSENRGKREQTLAELAREKRNFDQISDVWLNNREGTP